MDLLVSLAELPRILPNKLFADARHNSPLPNCGRRDLQEKQFATDSGEPAIKLLNIVPTNHTGPDAVSQMQRIDNHETLWLRVLLHTIVEPFDHAPHGLCIA